MFGNFCFPVLPVFDHFNIFVDWEDYHVLLKWRLLGYCEIKLRATATTVICHTKMAVMTLYNEELKQCRELHLCLKQASH